MKWRFKTHPHIQLKDKRNIFNIKTGRRIRLTTNGGCVGIWLGKSFIPKTKLNSLIELIPVEQNLPF